MSDIRPSGPTPVGNENPFSQPTPVAASPQGSTPSAPAYRCATQPRDTSAILVGCNNSISRYAAGATLQYYFDLDTFETQKEGRRALRHFKKAISAWRPVPVRFKRVYKRGEAFFSVVASNYDRRVYAEAFFPNDPVESRVLTVYPLAFQNHKAMYNVFCHELGHMLGLRHEFAGVSEQQDPSVRLGNANPRSIMNKFANLFDMTVQEEDIRDVVYFYTCNNVGGIPIDEVMP
ncbi:hypothetical protein Dda_7275 [Drechslerella dactyloides]|uniref:Peptidase metallopeptidase domain-containing protein n=1 Tax=Drechslerella dactyloides TaxID=74499 RepID=A0AAD6ITR0_DREDA|nr:hypothetical protein Dda_7275 [Drechslerella dactyloides]